MVKYSPWHLLATAVIVNLVVGQTDPNHRLNSSLTPKSYTVAITPYFNTGDDKAFTFDGEVSIVVTTTSSDVSEIKLHAEDLNFDWTNVVVTGPSTVIQLNPANPLTFNATYGFAYINLETALQSDTDYKITISYTGKLRDDMNGFYRSSYVENGETKWLGATQLEPTHARKVFPCFDEPSYKATFTLIISRPSSYSPSLANTKLQSTEILANGYVREVFYPTPVMSTYLVAFLVSEFGAGEYVVTGTKEFGIYSRKAAMNQSKMAFEFGQKVRDALGNYFGIDYYSVDENLKLDHVGLPDFRAGAMENWGLIKYREGSLLYDENESIPTYKYRIAQIMAHETTHMSTGPKNRVRFAELMVFRRAHRRFVVVHMKLCSSDQSMWFGNLVTCHWWSNTWLNEGFANYFQDYITALIEPEIGSGNVLATGSSYAAYEADEILKPSPISNEDVNSPSEISGHFGTITYQKGGSIIKMVHHLLGDEAFKFGLHKYLDTYRHQPGYPEYIYGALEEGVATTNALQDYPGINITFLMSSWIDRPGHPLLDVEVDNGIVTLTQRRFYANASYSTDEVYIIPVTYAIEEMPVFNNTKPAFIMTEKSHQLNLSTELHSGEWILFNIQETGFYRVNYDKNTWSSIAKGLKGNSTIHNLNRAKIVNDLFAFLNADVVDFDLLSEVLDFLRDEEDYSVWLAALDGLNDLRNKYLATEILDDIDAYSLNLLANIIKTLGFTEGDSDSYETVRNRMQILYHACRLGHQECIDFARQHFKNLTEGDIAVKPSLRPIVYCYGLKYGSDEDFDFLMQKMLTTNVANEASTIQSALGCTKNKDRLIKYLLSVVDPSIIRGQDSNYPWSSVLIDHSNVDLAFDVLKQNYTELSKVFPSMTTLTTYIASAMHTNEQFEEFESWLSSCQECPDDVKVSALVSLDTSIGAATWAKEHLSEISRSLRSSAAIAVPSLFTFFVVLASVLLV